MLQLRRLVPSGNALIAFEAAARHMSFTQAAGELNVTQPAVSRAIAEFERHLGYPLFERLGAPPVDTSDYTVLMTAAFSIGCVLAWRRYR